MLPVALRGDGTRNGTEATLYPPTLHPERRLCSGGWEFLVAWCGVPQPRTFDGAGKSRLFCLGGDRIENLFVPFARSW